MGGSIYTSHTDNHLKELGLDSQRPTRLLLNHKLALCFTHTNTTNALMKKLSRSWSGAGGGLPPFRFVGSSFSACVVFLFYYLHGVVRKVKTAQVWAWKGKVMQTIKYVRRAGKRETRRGEGLSNKPIGSFAGHGHGMNTQNTCPSTHQVPSS